jgi:hypothetical protein
MKAYKIEGDDNMVWLILGAYEGREGIEVVFENQINKDSISRFFAASSRPNAFIGTPLHKIRVVDPEDYEFDPKDFLGKFSGLISKPSQSEWNCRNGPLV